MQQKPADTQVEIHGIIKARWSPRAFNPDKQVSHDDLFAMAAEAATAGTTDGPGTQVIDANGMNLGMLLAGGVSILRLT